MSKNKNEKFMGVWIDEDKIQDFHMIALKEKKKLKDLHLEIIQDYIKKHGDGNPQFTIEQFQDPDFMACPAFYRSPTDWENYIKKATPEEKEKLKQQIISIDKKLGMYL